MSAELPHDGASNARWRARLPVADELQIWTATLPKWNPLGHESWDVFARRRAIAEEALARRLRGLPDCTLTTTHHGMCVNFTLAGVHVTTHEGLGKACQVWIATVRQQARS
jgi:hypothetical protein